MNITKDKNTFTVILSDEDKDLKEVRKTLKAEFVEIDGKPIKVFVKGYNASLVTLLIEDVLAEKVKSLTFIGEGLKDSYKAI
jgi:hypothetical protein